MAAKDTAPVSKPFMVTNTQARAIHTCGKTLIPGQPTVIDPQYVEALKASDVFKARWIVEGVAAMPAAVILDITKLDEEKAAKLIGVESDLVVLSAWSENEKRPGVLAAIEARLKSM